MFIITLVWRARLSLGTRLCHVFDVLCSFWWNICCKVHYLRAILQRRIKFIGSFCMYKVNISPFIYMDCICRIPSWVLLLCLYRRPCSLRKNIPTIVHTKTFCVWFCMYMYIWLYVSAYRFNTLRPRQNARNFADDPFQHIFIERNCQNF